MVGGDVALLPDVTPSLPMKANSFPIVSLGIGAPGSGDRGVPALHEGLELLVLPDIGVLVLLLPVPTVRLLFLGLE